MKFILLILFILTDAYALEWQYKVSDSISNLQSVPWKSHPNGNIVSREFEGYIEYRTFLDHETLNNQKQIYLGKIGDADKVYLNGIQVGQTGNFPPSFSYNMDTERSYYLPQSAIRTGSNEINILVYSKFLVNKGFSPSKFQVSNVNQIDSIRYTEELTNNLSKVIIPILCLVLAAVSFPLLAPKHLWNTQVMIFLIGVSSFILGICRGRILYHYFEMLSVYKLTMISSIFTLWLITVFMTKQCKSRAKLIPTLIGAGLLAVILLAPTLVKAASLARIWFHVSPLFLMFALYGSLKSNGKGSFRTFGLLVLLLTNINDNLNDLRIMSTISLLQIGLGTFISSMILDQLLSLKRSWERYFMKETQLEIDAAVGKQAIQIAHDLRSPIEAIKIGIDKITGISLEDEQSMRLGLKRIFEICDSLLGNKKESPFINSVSDTEIAVREVVHELSLKHAQDNLRIHLTINELRHDLTFEIDVARLKRTICNLIMNSIEASNNTGDIYVSIGSEESFLKIEVQDNGVGITSDTNQIFERGFTTKSHGNGLGLSSAKAFVESIGGMITVSKLHKGTLVSILIPASLKQEHHTGFKGVEKIVLIDDDALVRFNWKRQGQNSDISVHTFENMSDFLQIKNKYHRDTPIFIDSNLGEEKGEILSKKLVQSGFTKIILTTGAPEKSITNKEWISKIVGKSFESAVLGKHTLLN